MTAKSNSQHCAPATQIAQALARSFYLEGVLFLVLGAIGLVVGCSVLFPTANSRPLPALVGWGIVRAVWFGWSNPAETRSDLSL